MSNCFQLIVSASDEGYEKIKLIRIENFGLHHPAYGADFHNWGSRRGVGCNNRWLCAADATATQDLRAARAARAVACPR